MMKPRMLLMNFYFISLQRETGGKLCSPALICKKGNLMADALTTIYPRFYWILWDQGSTMIYIRIVISKILAELKSVLNILKKKWFNLVSSRGVTLSGLGPFLVGGSIALLLRAQLILSI